MCIALIVISVIIIALPFIILAPGFVGKKKDAFYGQNIAHRGLHTADQSVPENSLEAFRLAAEAGYGIELDVQLSKDGQVVVCHDDNLNRVCGIPKRIDELDYEELAKTSLFGTDQHVPLFTDVLKTVDGRVPMIVELKDTKNNKELCKKTLDLLKAYDGATCIESFNPLIVSYFAWHAPKIFRGQLSQPTKNFGGSFLGFALGNLLFNVIARPHFIAYRIGPKPISVRFCEALGAVKAAWTSHDESTEKDYDIVIFEYYTPKVKYK